MCKDLLMNKSPPIRAHELLVTIIGTISTDLEVKIFIIVNRYLAIVSIVCDVVINSLIGNITFKKIYNKVRILIYHEKRLNTKVASFDV